MSEKRKTHLDLLYSDPWAEGAVLACCMVDPELCDDVGPNQFADGHESLNGTLFTMLEAARWDCFKSEPTAVFLKRAVWQRDKFHELFGCRIGHYVWRLLTMGASVRNFDEYVERCEEAERFRNKQENLIRELMTLENSWQEGKIQKYRCR